MCRRQSSTGAEEAAGGDRGTACRPQSITGAEEAAGGDRGTACRPQSITGAEEAAGHRTEMPYLLPTSGQSTEAADSSSGTSLESTDISWRQADRGHRSAHGVTVRQPRYPPTHGPGQTDSLDCLEARVGSGKFSLKMCSDSGKSVVEFQGTSGKIMSIGVDFHQNLPMLGDGGQINSVVLWYW